MNKVIIRKTQIEDLKELSKIYTKAYNVLNIGENWTEGKAHLLLVKFYEQQPDLFFTAEDNEKIIGGIVSLVKPWWDGNHLTDGELFVDPDHQGRGAGTMLLKHMFKDAFDKYQAVSWDTFTHRVYEHPLKWYKKLGFEEIKQWVMITGDIKKVLGIG